MQALEIVEELLIGRKEPIYFLFDDWGCHPDEVPPAYENWLESNSRKLNITSTVISETRWTKYFRIDFNS